MLYNNLGELLALLKEHQLYTEKKFGQNFLFNTQVISKIISSANLSPTDQVIEIGPGLGILTQEILNTGSHLIAIEKDPKLIPYLLQNFSRHKNFQLLEQDVLEFVPPNHPYKVVANIPYYITSPIINHFYANSPKHQPLSMTILTQLEVAQKICSKPGDHSVLSLQTQLFADPKLIATVSAHNFYPAPKVKSAILHLETLHQPRLETPDRFLSLIKKAFNQKRKTLINSLEGWNDFKKDQLRNSLEQAKIPLSIRPQQLDFPDWQRLLNTLPDKN